MMIPSADEPLMSTASGAKNPGELSLDALFNIDISVASKSLMKQSEAPSIVTMITRPMIDVLGARSVAEALRDVPGFYMVDDGLTSNIAVRGVNAGPNSWSRIIKVMVDGHPVTDYSTGGTFLGPPNGLELPVRWIVERTFGWLNRYRLLSKEFERTIASSICDIHLWLSRLMLRRLAAG